MSEQERPKTYEERPHVAPASPPEPADRECMNCGATFDKDHGVCPNCGRPLRKTGPVAVSGPPSDMQQPDNIRDGGVSEKPQKPAATSPGPGPTEDPRLYGERPSKDASLGGTD